MFLISALFGEHEVTDDMLSESCKWYLSHGDEACIASMLTQYDPENEEDLIVSWIPINISESFVLTTCVKF